MKKSSKVSPFCHQAVWLTEFRKSLNFTQQNMAQCLDLFTPNYNRLETGRSRLGKDVLIRLLPLIDRAVTYGHSVGKKEMLTGLSEAMSKDYKNDLFKLLKKHI